MNYWADHHHDSILQLLTRGWLMPFRLAHWLGKQIPSEYINIPLLRYL